MPQFLNGLSVEYERRLLAKDQELTASKEALTKLRKQMESVQVRGRCAVLLGKPPVIRPFDAANGHLLSVSRPFTPLAGPAGHNS